MRDWVEVAAVSQATVMSFVPNPNSTAGSTGMEFLLCDSDLKGDIDLLKISSRAVLEWVHRAMGPFEGEKGEGKAIAPCLHLLSPFHSVNQLPGLGGFGD